MNPFTIPLLIVFSILVLFIGMPGLEVPRHQARLAQAYYLAQGIKSGKLPNDTVDPWGKLYKIAELNGELFVVSYGENGSTLADGFDHDDVSSEMSFPPHRKMMRRTRLQLLAVLILSVSPWMLLLVAYFRSRMLNQQIISKSDSC